MSFINNIVGFTKRSTLSKVGKSFTYNMFVETKDSSEHAFSQILKPMPGYSTVSSNPTGKPQGLYKVSRGNDGKPKLYGVWGNKLYLFTNNIPAFIGDIVGNDTCTFCETSGYGNTHPHLCICDGINVYAVDTTLNWAEQQLDFRVINMPLKYPDEKINKVVPAWIAQCYNYLIVGDKDTDIFYTSYQYPFESLKEDGTIDYDIFDADINKETSGHGHWTMSEWQPDNTIAGTSNGSRLFTLGERSFQVFTYTGSNISPFSSPDTSSKNIGIKNKDSLAKFGDNIFWLGSSDMGDNTIYMMGADANPIRISTDEIEDEIRNFNKNVINSMTFMWESHPFYVINFQADATTLAYDIREGGWINLGSRGSIGREGCFRYKNAAMDPDGNIVMQEDGVLVKAIKPYLSNGTVIGSWFEHDNTPILRKRAGGMLSVDHKPFKVASVKLITNNGDYPLITNQPAQVVMRYSPDGATWRSSRTHTLGKVGQYGYDTIFRKLGKVTYLTMEFASSDNIGFALYGIDIKGVSCKN